jgi:hypothetical protein
MSATITISSALAIIIQDVPVATGIRLGILYQRSETVPVNAFLVFGRLVDKMGTQTLVGRGKQ